MVIRENGSCKPTELLAWAVNQEGWLGNESARSIDGEVAGQSHLLGGHFATRLGFILRKVSQQVSKNPRWSTADSLRGIKE